jgi:hypothetical protein
MNNKLKYKFSSWIAHKKMNKRMGQKLNAYMTALKERIIAKCEHLRDEDKRSIVEIVNEVDVSSLIDNLSTKRSRVKNMVAQEFRCTANRANQEQCSRTKKKGCEYCGTHIKGLPHGVVQPINPEFKRVDVWAEDIGGIIYYIDGNKNVYKSEDIMNNKTPRIISKYRVVEGVYHLE